VRVRIRTINEIEKMKRESKSKGPNQTVGAQEESVWKHKSPSLKESAQPMVKPKSKRSKASPKPAHVEKPGASSRQGIEVADNAKPAVPSRIGSDSPTKTKVVGSKAAPEMTTTVEAKIDVGFGNQLFIRGQGDGLSWNEGKPLRCVAADYWVWSTTSAKEKLVFKLLINDKVWSQGEDWTIRAGIRAHVVPVFGK
jgi:hypothetical protein